MLKTFWVLTLASALSLAALIPVAHASPSAGSLKILELNFNSELVYSDTNFAIRDLRFNALVQWVKENDPDVLFFAEAWNYRDDASIAVSLAKALGYDVAYRVTVGAPGLLYAGDAVLAKKDLHMSGEKDIELPHSAAELGNGKTWVVAFGGVSYTVGVKLTLADGEPLYAYATHLLGSTPSDRADQANAIIADAHSRAQSDGVSWNDAQVVVAGDLNSAPTEPAPSDFVQAGFMDSFAVAHPGDTSCSDCEDPTDAWFNPFTIASGQFPSQTDESATLRDDYVMLHSPTLRPLADTLTFTEPYDGVWMSDHFGNFAILGDAQTPLPPNPVHDQPSPGAPTQVVSVTTRDFLCGQEESCVATFAPAHVQGARGLTFENNSDFAIEIQVRGPGNILITDKASLNPGERTSFSFNSKGSFTYSIQNDMPFSSLYEALLSGTIEVDQTGY